MVQINSVYRSIFVIVLLLTSLTGGANVTFKFSAGTISNGALKTRMENNISALLTEIARAGKTGTALNLSGISMEPAAKTRLNALWDDIHFVCDKSTNISKCLNDMQGYQVRTIPITMKPLDSSYTQSLNRELTISLNKNGVITGVRPAWEIHEDVSTIMNSGLGVTDTRQRREILKWVEDFRCYYNEKDSAALRQIYSDDALIITGSVVSRAHKHGDMGTQVVRQVNYKVQSKEEYLTKLFKNVFKPGNKINVEFDHISVVRSGSKENIYGVTLHQKWRSGSYSDEGWLFLLWDFNDPEKPQIHVRTWQPEQAVAQDGVFSIEDFFIP
ncbi:MAG: nuclear transport factor 2 family protein [Muribaculaceae bacterium]|nr:nuclear transport factor 2 family protein [Muribaculaceae bacterium]